jgi:hypothetical protein
VLFEEEKMNRQDAAVGAPAGARVWAGAAIACLIYFVVALLALHVLRPDYAPRSHFISDYAVGEYGWVMTTAFLALSGGCCTLMAGLWTAGPKTVIGRLGALLLGVASIGLIITAIYKTDLPGAPYTRSGEIHEMTFRVNTLSLVFGTLILSLSFGSSERWRNFRGVALALFGCIAAAVVIQIATLHKGAPYGLANRLFCAVMIAWLLATAMRLRAAGAMNAARPG